jgi:hypothetical protein
MYEMARCVIGPAVVTVPEWLARYLETTGKLGRDMIGRAAKVSRCDQCGALILTGLDADRCAGVARVDTTALAPIGEAVALIAGRATYALYRVTGRVELTRRDRWSIAGSPAGTRPYDVVAEHTCAAVDLPSLPSAYDRPAGAPATDDPPF